MPSTNRFCDDIWFIIGTYLSNLRFILRYWLADREFRQNYPTHCSFWSAMIKSYCMTHGYNYTDTMARLCLNESMGVGLLKALFSSKKCSRTGCMKFYQEFNNDNSQCVYHPGKLKSGGYLSCCRNKGFKSVGCKKAYHDGMFYSMVYSRRVIQEKGAAVDDSGAHPKQSESVKNLAVGITSTATTTANHTSDSRVVAVQSSNLTTRLQGTISTTSVAPSIDTINDVKVIDASSSSSLKLPKIVSTPGAEHITPRDPVDRSPKHSTVSLPSIVRIK